MKRPAAAHTDSDSEESGEEEEASGSDEEVAKKPSAANNDGDSEEEEESTLVVKREKGAPVTLENMTPRERVKYNDAMMMSENNSQLSLMVVNLKQKHNNHWKDYVQATPNKELAQE
jgi:hypothetical protein